jgi:Txe/YoeB family toxin of Txe-Axe toxin-antitoxin module
MMELYNYESTNKPEKIKQDTKNELADFKDFKEVMQKKDEVALKVNNLVSIIETVELPPEVKSQLT